MENENKIENPSESDIREFTSMGENTPTKVQLDKSGQESVLAAIMNAEVKEEVKKEEQKVELEDIEETCPHCDTTFVAAVPKDSMLALCPECKKVIPLCSKCEHVPSDCTDCIWCDTANFFNYLRGHCTVEKFLENLNPPLTDMTTSSNPMVELNYDNFLNEEGGDSVNWDIKYWDIYGMVRNCPFTESSPYKDVLDFVKEIVRKNKS